VTRACAATGVTRSAVRMKATERQGRPRGNSRGTERANGTPAAPAARAVMARARQVLSVVWVSRSWPKRERASGRGDRSDNNVQHPLLFNRIVETRRARAHVPTRR
jgi:hypothetical protein